PRPGCRPAGTERQRLARTLHPSASPRYGRQARRATVAELDENGTKAQLTIIDAPFLGHSLRKKDVNKQVIQYVRDQLNAAIHSELQAPRSHDARRIASSIDTRVHACLYFLTPNSHRCGCWLLRATPILVD